MENVVHSCSKRSTSSQQHLLDLNDYCLLEILSYFNLSDLISLSTFCKRLEYNAQRLFPRRLKLWKDIPDDESASEFLLSKIGPFLTEIEVFQSVSCSIDDTIDMLRRHCRNVSSILLHQVIPMDLSTLPRNLKNISIKFPENCTLTTGYLDNLKSFDHLRSLTLKFSSGKQIDSSFLTGLPPLKRLRLKNCSVEPMDLRMCLENSKTTMESLTLSKCFPQLPDTLNDRIDQLVKLNELEFQFNCGPADFIPLSAFNRLTSLKLSHSTASIDINKLFRALIDHNKIHTLSMSSIDSITKSLNRATLQKLHRLTNLRCLNFCETDFVTDDFFMEITKSKSLIHLTYKQTYLALLSFEAVLAVIGASHGLQSCNYMVYHDIGPSMMHRNGDQQMKLDLLNAYRNTEAFKRVLQCRVNISKQLTDVKFLFKSKFEIRTANL